MPFAGGVEEHVGPADVRFNKDRWAEDAPVNVRFCGEVHNRIDR